MKTRLSRIIDEQKYQENKEGHEAKCWRIAYALGDNEKHTRDFYDALLNQRVLLAGRQQAAVGAIRQTTAFNCFVSAKIEDDFDDILDKAKQAGQTMRLGGGIGMDFSTLRPKGDLIRTLGSTSSGPLSFMEIWDSVCQTVLSAGHRRGAMMGVMRVDHPDIELFIDYKTQTGKLTNFNISVLVTDEFMTAVKEDDTFDLVFNGRVYKTIYAKALWEKIMHNNYDWAEPGVLFIDTINRMNNLYYCETISATNPCGEQPLPPNGACLLWSLNLTKYILGKDFDYDLMRVDIINGVRAVDNVIDETIFPLEAQEIEAKNKRRMGLGITGLANALEMIGISYGSPEAVKTTEDIMKFITNEAYKASSIIALEKGSFPLFDKDKYLSSNFVKKLDKDVLEMIEENGIRNSHLTSIAPTGTISLVADNISSGIEPPFALVYERKVNLEDGTQETFTVEDYAYKFAGVTGVTSSELSPEQHIDMLCAAQKWVDSSVSKTTNVPNDTDFSKFKEIYLRAYEGGAKGCTTYRAGCKREGVLSNNSISSEEGAACFINPDTGEKDCG